MDDLLPLPNAIKNRVPPDMIQPEHDFGPRIGMRKAITLRDFLLFEGLTEEDMREMDVKRAKKGLPPLWED
jgi:hypothetical protein